MSNKGMHLSVEVKEKIRQAHLGEKAYNWKGEQACYKVRHSWARRHIPKPESGLCMICSKTKTLQLHNISKKYLLDLTDWMWICRSCHSRIEPRGKGKKEPKGKDKNKRIPNVRIAKCKYTLRDEILKRFTISKFLI